MDEVSKSTWGGKTASHVYTMYIGKEIMNDKINVGVRMVNIRR